MLKNHLLVISLSGLSMSIIYFLTEYPLQSLRMAFPPLYAIVFIALVFTGFYAVSALPIRLYLDKLLEKRRFQVNCLAAFICGSFIIHWLTYQFFHSYTPFFTNHMVYLSILCTSFVFWLWDSIFYTKKD